MQCGPKPAVAEHRLRRALAPDCQQDWASIARFLARDLLAGLRIVRSSCLILAARISPLNLVNSTSNSSNSFFKACTSFMVIVRPYVGLASISISRLCSCRRDQQSQRQDGYPQQRPLPPTLLMPPQQALREFACDAQYSHLSSPPNLGQNFQPICLRLPP